MATSTPKYHVKGYGNGFPRPLTDYDVSAGIEQNELTLAESVAVFWAFRALEVTWPAVSGADASIAAETKTFLHNPFAGGPSYVSTTDGQTPPQKVSILDSATRFDLSYYESAAWENRYLDQDFGSPDGYCIHDQGNFDWKILRLVDGGGAPTGSYGVGPDGDTSIIIYAEARDDSASPTNIVREKIWLPDPDEVLPTSGSGSTYSTFTLALGGVDLTWFRESFDDGNAGDATVGTFSFVSDAWSPA